MKNPFLIGDAIYLRPIEREDAGTCMAWLNDPEVARTLMRHLPLNRIAEEQWIEKACRDEPMAPLCIMVKETDRHIGLVGLHQFHNEDRHACFGLTIGEKDEWGRGYGTEATRLIVKFAFDTLNLNRVWLQVYEYNARGIRTYEKAGFRREGVLRQDHYRDGRYWDTILMGILREEWRHSRNG
jgi:[ribosomal protein S5]-alanine N-acetyltransferase